MSKPIKPIYAFISKQSFFRNQPFELLKKRMEDEGLNEIDFASFHAPQASAEEVIRAANTLAFLSPKRLVVLHDAHALKKADMDLLAQYAENPSESSVLVLIAETLYKTTKLYKAIVKNGDVLDRKAPAKRDLPAAVMTLFRNAGLRADLRVAGALINAVGDDFDALTNSVTKLKTYKGKDTQLEVADILEVISPSAEIKTYEFSNAFGERDLESSMNLLRGLFSQGQSPFSVHYTITSHIRELITARALIDRNEISLSLLSSKLKKPDWMSQRILAQAQNFSAKELRDALMKLAEMDEKMKTGSKPELLFDIFVLEILAGEEVY